MISIVILLFRYAVVAKLVDALDSKSSSLLGSVGSIPTDGIFKSSIGFRLMLFLYQKGVSSF